MQQNVTATIQIDSQAIVRELIVAIGSDRFDMWFANRQAIQWTGEHLVVRAEHSFTLDRIRAHLRRELLTAARRVLGHDVELKFEVGPSTQFDEDENSVDEAVSISHNGSQPAQLERNGSPASAPRIELHGERGRGMGGGEFAAGNGSSVGAAAIVTVAASSVTHSSQPLRLERGHEPATVETVAYCSAATSNTRSERPKAGEALLCRDGRPGASARPTLRSFEFGSSNAFARTAISQVIHQPGHISPLYLHGPIGSGKSHLLRALTGAFSRSNPPRRCLYLSAEQFLSDFVDALDGRGVPVFRRKCRGQDLLAIDDIQFFKGRRTQFALIELNQTIEVLTREGRQVVIAGDRPLNELGFLGQEVVNRISSGLVCPLQYPDFDSRQRIIITMAEQRQLYLAPEVVQLLAEKLDQDTRQLIGAVNSLHAISVMQEVEITVNCVQKVLGNLVSLKPSLSIGQIEAEVCSLCGIKPEEMRSDRRSKRLSSARMLAMFLARKHTPAAFSEIGGYFGGRSHSTVIAAHRKMQKLISSSQTLHSQQGLVPLGEAVRRVEQRLRVG